MAEQIARWRTIAELDARHGTPVGDALREAAAEVERLRAELALAMGPTMYLQIQQILDGALGGRRKDGAGAGLVAEIALIADRMRHAEAERDRLAEQVQRVRDVHRPVSAHVGDPDDDDTLTTVCVHCEVLYPCDTIRALDKTGAGS